MKLIDGDALVAYLKEWEERLRKSGECGGCVADLMERVRAAVASFEDVWCDPTVELPLDPDAGVLVIADGKEDNLRLEHAYEIGYYLGADEGWMLEGYPQMLDVRVHAWMELPDWQAEPN